MHAGNFFLYFFVVLFVLMLYIPVNKFSLILQHFPVFLDKLSCSRTQHSEGAQWLSGRVLDSRPKGRGFEPHRRHCVVSLSKNINPSLVLVQPRKTRPFITERLLMGRKESNQTNKKQHSDSCESQTSDPSSPNLILYY